MFPLCLLGWFLVNSYLPLFYLCDWTLIIGMLRLSKHERQKPYTYIDRSREVVIVGVSISGKLKDSNVEAGVCMQAYVSP